MLDEIGSKENVPAYIKKIKEGHGKLMGFGHRVYKNYDPRAKIIKWTAEKVFEVTGRNRKLDIALELERIALEDEYFIKRKLYPNVDFYSGNHLPGHGIQAGDVHRAVCDPAHGRAGWPNGRRCSPIRSRRSPVRGRFTRDTSYGSSWRPTVLPRSMLPIRKGC